MSNNEFSFRPSELLQGTKYRVVDLKKERGASTEDYRNIRLVRLSIINVNTSLMFDIRLYEKGVDTLTKKQLLSIIKHIDNPE